MVMVVFLFLLAANVQKNLAVDDRAVSAENSTEIQIEYVLLDDSNQCARKCQLGAPPMVCKYHFKVEWYETLTKACYNCPENVDDCFRKDCVPGDGSRRPIVVINRKLPGPAIEVCEGDEVIVDVENLLPTDTTSVHWHGQHQKDTPYMDGVPFISQCPITPWATFRYDFFAANPGTHFWHSHSGVQRADGAFGALIVRQPDEKDVHRDLYDYDLSEHIITLLDWDPEIAIKKFVSHHHSIGDNKPRTLLVNGLGRFLDDTNDGNSTPTARFYVEKNNRYRFRVINAGYLNCPIELSVDNHTLTVISSDGADFNAINATSLVTYAGERFDFILNANQPEDIYWIRFRGLMDCDERFTRAHQAAVLHYKEANFTQLDYPKANLSYEESHAEGVQVNSLNKGTEDNVTVFIPMPHLESKQSWDVSLQSQPDYQFYIAYDFYKLNNPHFHKFPEYGFYNVSTPNQVLTPQINHISMKFPHVPLMSQKEEFTDDMFCNETTVKNCSKEFCECPHVIQVPLNAVVEMVLIDEGVAYDANHPLHLHGYPFRVVAMEKVGKNTTTEEIKQRDKDGLIKRNLLDAPIKDTVTVPDGGYTIIRFFTNNPGYWLFHCHIEFHVELGMGFVLKVGDHKDMLQVPKNFPTCGSYVPTNDIEEKPSSGVALSHNYIASILFTLFLLFR